MTDLTSTPATSRRPRTFARNTSHHSPRADMTPMVDLAFLLITFFVMTAQMQQPTALSLVMPKDGPSQPVGESESLTLLLSADKTLHFYEGMASEVLQHENVPAIAGGTKELRTLLMRKQKELDAFKGRDRLMVLVKPMESSNYRLLIDVLDELKITCVSRFAVLDPGPEEKAVVAGLR